MAKFDTQKLLSHLTGKWHGRACQMCGASNWQAQDSTFMLMEFQGGSVVIGGPVIPVIPVTCMNCGNTILVNGVVAGAVEQHQPSPQKGGKKA